MDNRFARRSAGAGDFGEGNDMKFPTMDEFAQNVAEKVLDEIEYNGKTIRQWIEIISASEHGTDLAEVGTNCSEFPNNSDAISRQAAIDALENDKEVLDQIIRFTSANDAQLDHYVAQHNQVVYDIDVIKQLPPIQPKRGRWHYSDGKPARIGLSFGVVCDQCGTESEYCTNFCGECGADMRQKGENSESN